MSRMKGFKTSVDIKHNGYENCNMGRNEKSGRGIGLKDRHT